MNTKEIPPRDNLTRFIEEIQVFPMLTAESERSLALRWRDNGDAQALQQLVGSHLRLVVKLARGYRGYALPMSDLISQGNLGLMRAAEKFDPDRGARFSTYATWWIRAAIQEYVLHSWSLVKIGTTPAQKKLFFNLQRLKGELRVYEGGELSPQTASAIATELDVSEEEVAAMNGRMDKGDYSLQAGLNAESDENWQDQLVDPQADQETLVVENDGLARRRSLLEHALEKLTDRERHIFTARRLKEDPLTLQDLSLIYDISRERVRQIEQRTFDKVQKSMRNSANGSGERGSFEVMPAEAAARIASNGTALSGQNCGT